MEKSSDQKRSFKGTHGDPDMVLFADAGRLLVRTERHARAAEVAETYICKWLWEEAGNQSVRGQLLSGSLEK